MRPSRRWMLKGMGASASALAFGCVSSPNPEDDPLRGAEFVGLAALGPEPTRPLDSTYGEGLDGRRYVDLSRLDADSLVLSSDAFYVRTREPDLFAPDDWSLRVDGLVESEATLSLAELQALEQDQGVHLMECSGNGGSGAFGLLSAARWGGIPLGSLLDEVVPDPAATRIRIEGFDEHSAPSDFSTPGASWVFTRAQLEDAGAFLALSMNGEPLPPDHGSPARLLVPGWFGCCCIKWVQRITFVDDEEPATSQMQEFATRTHQQQAWERAADYAPADIQLASMPIRVEIWRAPGGALLHRVIGLTWGGTETTDALTIDWGEGPERVQQQNHEQTATWSLWEHTIAFPSPGTYSLAMGVDDESVPTRRLDLGWYLREVLVA